MKQFAYVRATSVSDATTQVLAGGDRRILAGGVDLLDLMKEHLAEPDVLVSLGSVTGLSSIQQLTSGVIRLGSRVTLGSLASSTLLSSSAKAVVDAASGAATPQIRNMATLGGNLLQRPRCWYFRNEQVSCLKKGGTTCPATTGDNRYLAILGGGPCYAVTASSPSIALAAMDALVNVSGTAGSKTIALTALYQSPSVSVTKETTLAAGDVITSVDIPVQAAGSKTVYLKQRHKEAFDWAMAEVAVRLTITNGTMTDVRIFLGAVAPIPWRATSAEALLKGKTLTASLATQAATEALAASKTLSGNGYKVNTARYLVEQAILSAGGLA